MVIKKTFFCFLFLLLLGAVTGCGKKEKEKELPEAIELLFFYNEPCASCDGTEEIDRIISEELAEVSDQYPYKVIAYNVFRQAEAQIRDTELKRLGFQEAAAESFTDLMMIVNGKAYLGSDAIRASVREAYLTAGEDFFVNQRGVFEPGEEQTLKQQLKDYPLEKDASSIVYFYRIVCEECVQTDEDVISKLPEQIEAEGRFWPQQVVRINTRSGRNGEILQAFFEKYNVPSEDQMVPIVFTAQGYLAGYEAISGQLDSLLRDGAGLGLEYPDGK